MITGSVGGDHVERAAFAAEGYDPDDPAVVAALARVSAVLAELGPLVWEASAILDKQSDSREELMRALKEGPRHRFSDWPNQAVPNVAAGVYTIWDHDRFIYVGMARRGLVAEDIDAPDEPVTAKRTSEPSQLACNGPTKRGSVLRLRVRPFGRPAPIWGAAGPDWGTAGCLSTRSHDSSSVNGTNSVLSQPQTAGRRWRWSAK